MRDKIYTIIVVPERSAKVRRFKIAHRTLMRLAVLLLLLVAMGSFIGVQYLYTLNQSHYHEALKQENLQLKSRLRIVQDEIGRIDSSLSRIEQFAGRVRAITKIHDPARHLNLQPLHLDGNDKPPEVLYAAGERIEYEDEMLDSKLAIRLIDASLENLEAEAYHQENNIRDLYDTFHDKDLLLASTPSIRPVSSRLLISGFGMRMDPYTDRKVLHKGVDFAADEGADVYAPGDGIVVFVGGRGNGYGNTVVIDHGYGIQTHYAHLSRILMEIGQVVRRGQVIASVGHTGRSTSAHLHYEVRFYGIPQDPERFILEQP